MPAANPFAPVIEIGGQATAGPVSAGASANVGANVGDHHVAAGWILVGLLLLVALHRARFRFSQTVG